MATNKKGRMQLDPEDVKIHTTQKVEEVQADMNKIEKPEPAKLRCGYQVGLREDGSFVFELLGEGNGAVELMGLHKYAEVQIDNLVMPSVQHSSFALLQNLKVIYQQLEAVLKKQSAPGD